jgi:hypothetical protein
MGPGCISRQFMWRAPPCCPPLYRINHTASAPAGCHLPDCIKSWRLSSLINSPHLFLIPPSDCYGINTRHQIETLRKKTGRNGKATVAIEVTFQITDRREGSRMGPESGRATSNRTEVVNQGAFPPWGRLGIRASTCHHHRQGRHGHPFSIDGMPRPID